MHERIILIIGVACVLVIVSIGVAFSTHQRTISNKMMVEAGLEECPISPNGMSNITIWVKDCTSYVDQLSKHK